MSIEEKAKAYDKALEKAKKELNACGSLDCDAARQIFRLFPELHEEEKPLTPFQQCLNCILRGVYYAEVPDEKVNEFILSVVRTRTDELIKLAKIHEYTDYQLHKSEDEQMMQEFNDWLCEEIECRTSSLCDEKDRRTLNMLCYILKKVKDWLEKQEQKPAWSEEDKEALDMCLDTIPKKWKTKSGILLTKWLKDNIQPQPKPEWSEEDKDFINMLILHFNYLIDKGGDSVETYKSYREKLKSLRPCPSWKPSDHQMNILKAVKEYVGRGSGYWGEGLGSLIEDLEKLM